MTSLLDVNFLVSLAWPSHVHHDLAHAWFARHSDAGWATCPLTQCGFVRVSSNPKIIREAASVREALGVLAGFLADKHHSFWPDDIALLDEALPTQLLLGHHQVSDAYLLGLAIKHGGCLVTLDRSVTSLLPANSPHRDALVVVTDG